MTQPYHVILTDAGAAALAQAIDSGQPLQLAEIAVGDGGGGPITPVASATALTGERWRGALTDVRIDADNPAWVIAETVIPPSAGGWWIREVGLYSAAGELVAIGSHPETYKPVLADGSATDLVIRMILQVSSADAIQLSLDPSAVLATGADVQQLAEAWLALMATDVLALRLALQNHRRHVSAF